jgi:hypothetical protein
MIYTPGTVFPDGHGTLHTSGTALMAPTTTDVSHRATTAPPPYKRTVGLSSTASHCKPEVKGTEQNGVRSRHAHCCLRYIWPVGMSVHYLWTGDGRQLAGTYLRFEVLDQLVAGGRCVLGSGLRTEQGEPRCICKAARIAKARVNNPLKRRQMSNLVITLEAKLADAAPREEGGARSGGEARAAEERHGVRRGRHAGVHQLAHSYRYGYG